MVNITYSRGTPYERKAEIPVKVVQDNGEYKIGYITPEYLGQAYGDSLLPDLQTELAALRNEYLTPRARQLEV